MAAAEEEANKGIGDFLRKTKMQLSTEDRVGLENLLSGGIQPVRTVRRALVLLQLGEGKSSPQVAASVGVVVNTVCEIRKRYEQGGLRRALYDKARPGGEPLLKPKERQQIIAMVCGPAPAGQARWSVRLIAGRGGEAGHGSAGGTRDGASVVAQP